jgi:multiple sugar transport system substrate-binding protein
MNLKRQPIPTTLAALAIVAIIAIIALCTSASAATQHRSALTGTISVAYSTTYVFDADDLSVTWWNNVKSQFEKTYPGANLKLQGFDGTDVDLVNKVALLYKSKSTTPDVFMLPTGYVGQWVSSKYLAPLDKYLNKKDAPFWSTFPKVIQNESRINGHVYAVNTGENDSAIYYNKAMLTKAGIKLPWRPKTWAQIISAAKKVKAANLGVVPLWAAAGTSAGAGGVLQGSANLVLGSKTPIIFDKKTHKWVADSRGLRDVFQFYKSVYSNGLGASTSDLFSPKAVGRPVVLLKDHQLAIAIGSNWFADAWTEENRHWPTAKTEAAAVPLPTSHGQKPGSASTLGGWAVAISQTVKNKDLAWALIKIMQRDANQVYIANHAGFVPPSKKVAKSKGYLNYAPPFNTAFAAALPNARVVPSNEAGYPVWVQGIGQATGQIASNPQTSVADAIKTLRDTLVNQLGAKAVETKP